MVPVEEQLYQELIEKIIDQEPEETAEEEDEDDRYWLWRFMIDQHEQGKGYGQASLAEIIKYFNSKVTINGDLIADGFAFNADESTWTVGPYSGVSTDHRTARPCSA